jgi:hypothetical protein
MFADLINPNWSLSFHWLYAAEISVQSERPAEEHL